MLAPHALRVRAARADDVDPIVALHADSWQRHYRGAFSDSFLDNDVTEYLRQLWTARLAHPESKARTFLAETDGTVAGFAHTLLGDHRVWGALLDNLHVGHDRRREGVGTRLLAVTAQNVLAFAPASGLYLWVLERNRDARAFYAARGGAIVGRAEVPPPGGDPTRLNGRPMRLRYAWQDPSELLAPRRDPTRPLAAAREQDDPYVADASGDPQGVSRGRGAERARAPYSGASDAPSDHR